MKNSKLIELLSSYDGNQEVVVDGADDFMVEEMGDDDNKMILIIKQ